MIDAENYYLRPRQRIQIFDSDDDDDFQARPNTSKAYVKQRGDFIFETKNEGSGQESSGNQMEHAGTNFQVDFSEFLCI